MTNRLGIWALPKFGRHIGSVPLSIVNEWLAVVGPTNLPFVLMSVCRSAAVADCIAIPFICGCDWFCVIGSNVVMWWILVGLISSGMLRRMALIQAMNAKTMGNERRWRSWASRGCWTVAKRSSDSINRLMVLAATGTDCKQWKTKYRT